MPFYRKLGAIPHKRHTQFRKPDGALYREEVMGLEGFSGIQSILYHHFCRRACCASRLWALCSPNILILAPFGIVPSARRTSLAAATRCKRGASCWATAT